MTDHRPTADAAGQASGAFDVTLASDVAEIPKLHERVEAFAEEHGVPFVVVNAVNLALDEVLTNIVTHGVREDDQVASMVEVRVELLDSDDGRCLRIAVEDDTGAFDMLVEAKEPDTLAPVEERTVGGLGIFLVKQMMDRVAYERRDDRNLLVLEKKIPGSDAG